VPRCGKTLFRWVVSLLRLILSVYVHFSKYWSAKMSDLNCEVFKSSKGYLKLSVNGYNYNKNRVVDEKHYWICELYNSDQCKSRAITLFDTSSESHTVIKFDDSHNHDPDSTRLSRASIIDSLKCDASNNTDTKTCQIISHAKRNYSELVLSQLPSTSALRRFIYLA
jgi:hypothetical protein